MGRRPIFLISTENKSAEQLADEAWQALQAYWRATGQIEPNASDGVPRGHSEWRKCG
jgi:hypothetical protein